MFDLLKSASKIVLIILATTVCVGFIMGKLDSKDFMILAAMVFTYYFSYKPGDPTPSIPPDSDVPPVTIK